MAIEAEDIRLLANIRLRRLLTARVLAQLAQNAMLYALLILVVERTGSSIHSTLLIIAFMVPSIVLGVPAGIAVDFLPKRAVLVTANLLRAAIVGALVFYQASMWWVYLLVLGFSTVGQFFAPTESATLPSIVRREQLTAANSLMNFTLMAGQVAGMVILAPFLLKTLGNIPVFTVAVLLFLGAAYFVAQVGTIGPPASLAGPANHPHHDQAAAGFRQAFLKGWELIRTNRRVFLAILHMAIMVSLAKVMVILAPRYVEDVLKISAEDTVFVAAPAAIGALLGLAVAPPLGKLVGTHRVVTLGFLLFVLGLIGLGLVVYIRDFVESNLHLGLSYVEERVGVSSVISMTMILAIPIGLAFSLVGVAARAVINEEAPAGMQGRVFATQMALADAASLLPLLAVGAIAELVGVRAVLLTVAIAALLVGEYMRLTRRFGPAPAAERPAEAG